MEMRQLRYFLAVAEELHFTRAAERIGISQPPLSQQIIALEHQLGVTLFVRDKRNVALTAAGEELVRHARRILNTTAQAELEVQAISKGERGLLKIGAVFSSLYGLVPKALSAFHASWPDVQISLHEMTIRQQVDSLSEGSIDVGVLRGPFSHPRIESIALFEERVVAVLPAGHRLAAKPELSLEEIANESLIGVMPSALHNGLMFTVFTDRGYSPNIVHMASGLHTIIPLVSAGLGISVVPEAFRNIPNARIAYRDLSEPIGFSTMQLAWNPQSISHVLPHFISTAKAFIGTAA